MSRARAANLPARLLTGLSISPHIGHAFHPEPGRELMLRTERRQHGHDLGDMCDSPVAVCIAVLMPARACMDVQATAPPSLDLLCLLTHHDYIRIQVDWCPGPRG